MSGLPQRLFCPYCNTYKPEEGFKFVFSFSAGTKRRQCASCQATRKLPRGQLEELARQERDQRNANTSARTRAGIERKKKNEK